MIICILTGSDKFLYIILNRKKYKNGKQQKNNYYVILLLLLLLPVYRSFFNLIWFIEEEKGRIYVSTYLFCFITKKNFFCFLHISSFNALSILVVVKCLNVDIGRNEWMNESKYGVKYDFYKRNFFSN